MIASSMTDCGWYHATTTYMVVTYFRKTSALLDPMHEVLHSDFPCGWAGDASLPQSLIRFTKPWVRLVLVSSLGTTVASDCGGGGGGDAICAGSTPKMPKEQMKHFIRFIVSLGYLVESVVYLVEAVVHFIELQIRLALWKVDIAGPLALLLQRRTQFRVRDSWRIVHAAELVEYRVTTK